MVLKEVSSLKRDENSLHRPSVPMLGRSLRVFVITHEAFELELLGVGGLAIDSVGHDCMAVGGRALFVFFG